MSKRIYINCNLCGRFISQKEMETEGIIEVKEDATWGFRHTHVECLNKATEKMLNGQSCNFCEIDTYDDDVSYDQEVLNFEEGIVNALKKVWIKDNIHFWKALSNIGDYAKDIEYLVASDEKNPFIMYGINKNS